jgi:hypothetical protein
VSKHSLRYRGGDVFVSVDVEGTTTHAVYGGVESPHYITKAVSQEYERLVAGDIEIAMSFINEKRGAFTRRSVQQRYVAGYLSAIEQRISDEMGEDN